jgi:hypothetical protein
MIFDHPVPFKAAMKVLADKNILPTAWNTAELRANLEREIRRKALFSARTLSMDYLGEVQSVGDDFLAGKINQATAVQRLQVVLDQLGYTPETGFGMKEAPPAEPGDLRDLSSDRRVRLVVQTNVRMAANTAYMTSGQTAAALYQFPCWELVRIYSRQVPRGMKKVKGGIQEDPGNDWPSRWVEAGGELVDDRMIARKDDPIWSSLGDSSVFPDGTDSDAPPYAFGSGMGLRSVPREDCIALGVIDEGEAPEPTTPDINGDLFADKTNATLADLKASRAELLNIINARRAA